MTNVAPIDGSDAGRRTSYIPQDKPYDPARPVKAIIIGAGIAGIAASVLLPKKVPNFEYSLYERHDTVGGTWTLNRYPGVRCDVVSHIYQFGFEPNHEWPEAYPEGAYIREYYEGVVKKYGVDKHLKLRHEVVEARWQDNKWTVQVKNLETGDIFADTAEFLVSATGILSKWKLPEIPGLESFQGPLMHTAHWDPNFDPAGKRIAVIGNGASGLQLIPNLLKRGATGVDHYVHGPTWIAASLDAGTPIPDAANPGGPKYSHEQQQRWKANPDEYLEFRRSLEYLKHQQWKGTILHSRENDQLRAHFVRVLQERVPSDDEELLRKLTPDYAPACRRPTPAPGYLESIVAGKTVYVADPICAVTATGVVTAQEDGGSSRSRAVDAIVAATGFDTGYAPRFATIAHGVNLQEAWSPALGRVPATYLGVMAPGFPNCFFTMQAQSFTYGGSVQSQAEDFATYMAKCMRKIQSQSYVALSPSPDATDDFHAVVEGYFANKVEADRCSNWFKLGGRVVGAWPGTAQHNWLVRRDPRWEDFVFVRDEAARHNRFEYFGNGWTERERRGDREELTRYVVGPDVDLATYRESWNE